VTPSNDGPVPPEDALPPSEGVLPVPPEDGLNHSERVLPVPPEDGPVPLEDGLMVCCETCRLTLIADLGLGSRCGCQ
jgi:hypothetical protein